jgi:ATP-dependent Lon protease
VLPIGGIKEKALGAHRAGIKTIILPRRNEADLEDLPREVLDEMEFVLVDTLDEVLAKALLAATPPSAHPTLGMLEVPGVERVPLSFGNPGA